LENYGSKQVIIENGGHRLEHQTFDRRAHNRYFDRKILGNIASRTIVKNQNKNYLRLDCVYSCEQVLCWRLFPSGAYAVKSVLRRILREIPIQLEN